MIETYEDDLTLTDDDIKGIQKSLDDLKAGRVYTHQQIKKELGL